MVHADREEGGNLAIMLARFGHCVSFADGSEGTGLSTDMYDLIIVDEDISSIIVDEDISSGAGFIFLSNGDCEAKRICRNSTYECMEKPVKPIDLAVVVCDFFVSRLVSREDMASFGH